MNHWAFKLSKLSNKVLLEIMLVEFGEKFPFIILFEPTGFIFRLFQARIFKRCVNCHYISSFLMNAF